MFVQDDGRLPPFSIDEAVSFPKVSSVLFNPGNVLNFLKKLKSNGSGGVDKLPNVLFKNIASEILSLYRAFSMPLCPRPLLLLTWPWVLLFQFLKRVLLVMLIIIDPFHSPVYNAQLWNLYLKT